MQGAMLNIVHAYRNSLLAPQHKAYIASMWHGNIYVDHCAIEGLSSSGNIQGIPADALIAILRHHGVDAVLKLVDKFCLSHIPTHSTLDDKNNSLHHYSIDLTSVFSITDPLSVPWHPVMAKGQDFASSIVYVGFLWDLEEHTVSLPTKKHMKYLGKVQAFLSNAKARVSCKEVLAIHGMLQHITFVYRQGHSSLPPSLPSLPSS